MPTIASSFRLGRLRALALAAAIAAAAIVGQAGTSATAQEFTPSEAAQIEDIVRNYLIANPEVIVDALDELQRREELAAAEAQRQAVANNRDALFNNPDLPYLGADDPAVTIVEFMDYQCGYCKRMLPALQDLVTENPDLRIVLIDIPILGPTSVTAARAALAARYQDGYRAMHNRMMGFDGQLSEAAIFRFAEESGLDLDQLRADMDRPEVADQIQLNLSLANALGVRGTPAYVVGDNLVPGAVGQERLQQAIDALEG